MLLQLSAKPVNINLIQVYAPTSDKPDAEVEQFYEQIQEVKRSLKPQEIIMVMGDFNAKVGKGSVAGVSGSFGLGERNERGDTLIRLCREENLMIKNTYFKLPPRRLYTWKSPGDRYRNQIDFFLVNQRFQNSITHVITYPGADIGSDHNPLVANISLRCKLLKKPTKKRKPDIGKTHEPNIRENLKQELNRLCLISDPTTEENPNDIWTKLRANIEAATESIIGYEETTKHKPWMTKEILSLMENRRLAKNHQDRYKEINRIIRQKIKEAKELWIAKECEEAESLHILHDSFNFHKKLRQITGTRRKTPLSALHNEHGKLILEEGELTETWKKYASALFDDNRDNLTTITHQLDGPEILEAELRKALNTMKNNRCPGHDNVYAEVLKQVNTKQLTYLFNKIYESGHIPTDWLKSTFVAIPKKNNPKQCEDFRLISLLSHALKVFLRIIHARIYSKCEEMSGETQFGFVRGLGTREALFSMKLLIQKCYDQQQSVFVCFIDYQRAFDNVKHDLLLRRLGEIGVEEKNIQIIRQLYWNQTAEIKINNTLSTESFNILKGVRQGCILSPILFNIYVEKIFQLALEDETRGIKINGKLITNIRYADDTAILANSIEDLQILLNKLNEVGTAFGLNINIKKTKMMIVSRKDIKDATLSLNGEDIERVVRFKYLGAVVNEKWDCDEEVKLRIGMAKETFSRLKNLLLQRTLPLELRLRVVHCYVWPVLLYGSETWSLKVKSLNRIEAFEMWTLRRLLRIPWTDHLTNQEVLRRAGVERQLLNIVRQKKVSYLGHILRGDRYSIPKLIIQGKIEGRRGPGRKQHSWLRNIRDWCGVQDAETLFRMAENNMLTLAAIN